MRRLRAQEPACRAGIYAHTDELAATASIVAPQDVKRLAAALLAAGRTDVAIPIRRCAAMGLGGAAVMPQHQEFGIFGHLTPGHHH